MAAGHCAERARSSAASASAARVTRTATSSWRCAARRRWRGSRWPRGARGAIRGGFEIAKRMPRRRAFSLPGLSAPNAVAPDLVRVGELFFSSGVRGVDLRTGELPAEPDVQFANAWRNLAQLVESAGLSTD